MQVHGEPPPKISWYKDNLKISNYNDSRYNIQQLGSNCIFSIRNVTAEDSGRYVCEAINQSKCISSFSRLIVLEDPKILEAGYKSKM